MKINKYVVRSYVRLYVKTCHTSTHSSQLAEMKTAKINLLFNIITMKTIHPRHEEM